MRHFKEARLAIAVLCFTLLISVYPAAKASAVDLPGEIVSMLDLRLLRASSYSINQESRTVEITAEGNATSIGIYKNQDGSVSTTAYVTLTPAAADPNVTADPATGFIRVVRPFDTADERTVQFPIYYYEGWYRFTYIVSVKFPAIYIPDLRAVRAESISIDNTTRTIRITPEPGETNVGIFNTQNGTFGRYGYLTNYSSGNPYVTTDPETGFIKVIRPDTTSMCEMGFVAAYQQGAYKSYYTIIVEFPAMNVDLETFRALRAESVNIDNDSATIRIIPSTEGILSVGIYKTQLGAFDEHVYLSLVGGDTGYVSVDETTGFITVRRPDTTGACTMGLTVRYQDSGISKYYTILVDFPVLDIYLSNVRTSRVENAVIDEETRTITLTPSSEGVESVGVYRAQLGTIKTYGYLSVSSGSEPITTNPDSGYITIKRDSNAESHTIYFGSMYKEGGITSWYSFVVNFPAIGMVDLRADRDAAYTIDNSLRTISVTAEANALNVGIYKYQTGSVDKYGIFTLNAGSGTEHVTVDATSGYIKVSRPQTKDESVVSISVDYTQGEYVSTYSINVTFPANDDLGLLYSLRTGKPTGSTTVASYIIDNVARTITATAREGARIVGIFKSQYGTLIKAYGDFTIVDGSAGPNITVNPVGYIYVNRSDSPDGYTESFEAEFTQGGYMTAYTVNIVFPPE